MPMPSSPKARPAASQTADINVTPFVDIMLVMLIIFMVSAPLATVAFRLDMPPPVTDAFDNKEPVYITVGESGGLFISERPTSLETLSTDLCATLGGGDCRQERVFVRGEPDTPYHSFMAVMNDLQSHGFFKVGLLNEDIT